MKNSGSLSVQTMTGECKNYHSIDFTEDIMADVHNYYRYHFFEDYESIYEPEIDQTDYELKKNLNKGFYDQF